MNPGTLPRPNLQKIADAAAVSRMTVSMALRNDPRVAEATKARVLAIAERLGYRPNPMVSALMTHIRSGRAVESTTTIVFLSAFPKGEQVRSFPTYRLLYRGAERRAAQLGYHLEEWSMQEPGMTGARLSRILYSRGIQALLIGPQPISLHRRRLRLEWHRFACATFNFRLWKPDLHRVANNHYLSMMMLLRQLRRLGYRRVGLALPAYVDNGVNNAWSAAYLAFQLHKCPDPAQRPAPLLLAPPDFDDVLPAWLDRTRPDAVIGLEFLPPLLQATGRRIPEDIGFANLDLHHLDGRCAGMNQNAVESGAAAIDLIDGQMRRNERGLPGTPLLIQIGSTWVPGATVRAAANGKSPTDPPRTAALEMVIR